MKFLAQSQSVEVTRTVAPQLVAMKKHSTVSSVSCPSRGAGTLQGGQVTPWGDG